MSAGRSPPSGFVRTNARFLKNSNPTLNWLPAPISVSLGAVLGALASTDLSHDVD